MNIKNRVDEVSEEMVREGKVLRMIDNRVFDKD